MLRVDRLEAFAEPPDLAATVGVFGDPDNPLPFWTFLTFGLVPTIAKGFDGVFVGLTATATKRTLRVEIDTPRDLIVIGWVGLLMLPSREWVLPRSFNDRLFDRIAGELAARADLIETQAIGSQVAGPGTIRRPGASF